MLTIKRTSIPNVCYDILAMALYVVGTVLFTYPLIENFSKPFSEMADEVMRYPSTGEVNFRVEDKAGAIQKLQDAFPLGEADFLDGVTLSFGSLEDPSWWWVNLRPSNTPPASSDMLVAVSVMTGNGSNSR